MIEALVVLAVAGAALMLIFSVGVRSTEIAFRLGRRALDVADRQLSTDALRTIVRGLDIAPTGPGKAWRAAETVGDARAFSGPAILAAATPCAGSGPTARITVALTGDASGDVVTCRAGDGRTTRLIDLRPRRARLSYSDDGLRWRETLDGVRPLTVTGQPARARSVYVRLATDDGRIEMVERATSGRPERRPRPARVAAMTGRADKQGFALPAVLAVTAIVTLVFLVAVLALNSLGDQTRRVVELGRFETQALSLEAHAAYLAAVGQPTPTGIIAPDLARGADPRLAADGTPYQPAGAPPLRISLQDEAGLINLDALSQAAIARLVAELGAPLDRRPALVDRFSDYVDLDDLARADGAETTAYRDRGLAPPPNAPLRSVDQVLGVLDWKDAVPREGWRAGRDDLTVDAISTAFNGNTATPRALKVLFGFTDAQVATVVERRRAAAFTGLEDLGRAAGVRLSGDAERVYGFPNGRFAVKIAAPGAGLTYRARIVLTPRDRARPVWVEDDALSLSPPSGKAEPLGHAPLLPDPAPAVADPGRPVRAD